MKTMRLIVVGIMLSTLMACVALKETASTAITLDQLVQTLKAKDCDVLSDSIKESDAQLLEARNALHALMTGKRVVRIQKYGRSVEYTETSKREL